MNEESPPAIEHDLRLGLGCPRVSSVRALPVSGWCPQLQVGTGGLEQCPGVTPPEHSCVLRLGPGEGGAVRRRHPCAYTALARPPRYARSVGDAVYTLRSLRDEIRPFLIAAGAERYLRSLRHLSAFWQQHPEAILVPTHDPDAWRQLERPRG